MPLLTCQCIKVRLKLRPHEHLKDGDEIWRSVLWSDETARLFDKHGGGAVLLFQEEGTLFRFMGS